MLTFPLLLRGCKKIKQEVSTMKNSVILSFTLIMSSASLQAQVTDINYKWPTQPISPVMAATSPSELLEQRAENAAQAQQQEQQIQVQPPVAQVGSLANNQSEEKKPVQNEKPPIDLDESGSSWPSVENDPSQSLRQSGHRKHSPDMNGFAMNPSILEEKILNDWIIKLNSINMPKSKVLFEAKRKSLHDFEFWAKGQMAAYCWIDGCE